ncbi:MAG: hypothetical protein WCH34_08635 [Bacteroidota bacterium]
MKNRLVFIYVLVIGFVFLTTNTQAQRTFVTAHCAGTLILTDQSWNGSDTYEAVLRVESLYPSISQWAPVFTISLGNPITGGPASYPFSGIDVANVPYNPPVSSDYYQIRILVVRHTGVNPEPRHDNSGYAVFSTGYVLTGTNDIEVKF